MINKSNNQYGIQMIIRGSDNGWIDFDEAKDKSKLDLRFSWINHYYPDDKFRKVKYEYDSDGNEIDYKVIK